MPGSKLVKRLLGLFGNPELVWKIEFPEVPWSKGYKPTSTLNKLAFAGLVHFILAELQVVCSWLRFIGSTQRKASWTLSINHLSPPNVVPGWVWTLTKAMNNCWPVWVIFITFSLYWLNANPSFNSVSVNSSKTV